MEEEIDVRQYIAVLLQYKYWIVGLAVVAALVAMGVSFLLPPTFQATALVVVVKPRYTIQFDSRMATNNIQTSYKAYLDLATSDQLVQELSDDLASEPGAAKKSVQAMKKMLKAANGSDPSVIRLTVIYKDPTQAAHIANRWAELFVARTNKLYGQGEENLTFLRTQLAAAQESLAQAEQDLTDFQARNKAGILSDQLNDKRGALQTCLSTAHSLRLVVQDARALQERLSSQDAASPASLGDELSILLLQLSAQSAEPATRLQMSDQRGLAGQAVESLSALPSSLQVNVQGTGRPAIQLQISSQELAGMTVDEQIALLDSLIAASETRLKTLETEMTGVEPDILSLQKSLAQADAEDEQLKLARDIASETVLTLARKVAEAQISAQNEEGGISLVSSASVPRRPVSPRKTVNTAVAGALGLFVGAFGALAIEYWKSGKKTPQVVKG